MSLPSPPAKPDSVATVPGASPQTGSSRSRPRPIPWLDLVVLSAVAGGFVALVTIVGQLRFENFFTTNWDLGINQQLLWTTAHGRIQYETGDAEFYNVRSFLQVHPAYVAFLLTPIYAALPYPSTLFVIQGCVFVGSTVPLYLIARSVLRSRPLIFLVLGLYLFSFPVISGILYDFHWEAFMPLEFLSFFYLFRTKRFALSAIPLTFGILTLEVFPFLVGGLGALILLERTETVGLHPRRLARDRQFQIAVALLAAMAIVYIALRYVQYVLVPLWIGYSGTPAAVSGAISDVFIVNVTSASLGLSAAYWFLLLAAFAFLPLFAPRYLILSLPWFIYSFFLTPFFSSQFGNQYSLVAVSTLSVALIYGAARVNRIAREDRSPIPVVTVLLIVGAFLTVLAVGWSPLLLSRSIPLALRVALVALPIAIIAAWWYERRVRPSSNAQPSRPRPRWLSRPRVRTTAVATLAVTFVAFNLLMSPLNPTNFMATEYPGYWVKYTPDPAAADMGWLTSFIPKNAVVLASDFLFTYVANNPNAWAVPWYPPVPGQPPLYLPFSATNLPEYVLIDQADWFNFPCSISSQLLNTSAYGLVAYVYSTANLGTISLYRLGYHGPVQIRYVGPTPPPTRIFTADNLTVGPSGRVADNPDARYGTVIMSYAVPSTLTTPLPLDRGVCEVLGDPPVQAPTASAIWYGPYDTFAADTYVITANLSGALAADGNASEPILTLDGGPYFVPPIFNISVYADQLSPTHWTSITWTMELPATFSLVEFRGYLDYFNGRANGAVTLNYIQVTG